MKETTIRSKLLFAAAAMAVLAFLGGVAHIRTARELPPAAVPTVSPSPSAAPLPTKTPAATPTPSPTPVPTPFALAWITDTQTLTMYESTAAAIVPMFRWVEQTREEYDTVALIHTGDLVENGWNPKYWERINPGIAEIGTDLPFLPAAGNHDVAKNKRSYEPWFAQPFLTRQDPARQYRGGEGYYEVIRAGGESIVIVTLGYISCDADGMAWAREVFDTHADSVGILAVHSYLSKSPHTTSTWTREGERLRTGVVACCENVRLVLCGHVRGTACHEDRFDDDEDGTAERRVAVLRHNEQDRRYPDQVGWLRMLTLDPIDRSIEVSTYSPVLDRHYTHESQKEEENFVLTNAF